jgi:hypothetical protein
MRSVWASCRLITHTASDQHLRSSIAPYNREFALWSYGEKVVEAAGVIAGHSGLIACHSAMENCLDETKTCSW